MSDPIDKLAMPASALAAMAKAVPTDVLRDIARDNCPRAAMVAKWSPTADHAPGSNARAGMSGHISQYKSTLTGIEQNGSGRVRSNLHSVSSGHRSARHEGKPRAPFARSVVVDLCRCD